MEDGIGYYPQPKLGDFGLSAFSHADDVRPSNWLKNCGTLDYMADVSKIDSPRPRTRASTDETLNGRSKSGIVFWVDAINISTLIEGMRTTQF